MSTPQHGGGGGQRVDASVGFSSVQMISMDAARAFVNTSPSRSPICRAASSPGHAPESAANRDMSTYPGVRWPVYPVQRKHIQVALDVRPAQRRPQHPNPADTPSVRASLGFARLRTSRPSPSGSGPPRGGHQSVSGQEPHHRPIPRQVRGTPVVIGGQPLRQQPADGDART